MEIVRHHLHVHRSESDRIIPIPVDREVLAKRRWRAIAGDGREFGFDLDHLLSHGDFVLQEEGILYAIRQREEPVFEIPLGYVPAEAARIAWQLGNLHFPIQIVDEVIRVAADVAVRQMLDREQIPYFESLAVFCPATAGAAHHHHHHD